MRALPAPPMLPFAARKLVAWASSPCGFPEMARTGSPCYEKNHSLSAKGHLALEPHAAADHEAIIDVDVYRVAEASAAVKHPTAFDERRHAVLFGP